MRLQYSKLEDRDCLAFESIFKSGVGVRIFATRIRRLVCRVGLRHFTQIWGLLWFAVFVIDAESSTREQSSYRATHL